MAVTPSEGVRRAVLPLISCPTVGIEGRGRANADIDENLSDGKRPAVEIADRYAQADEPRFQVHAEGLARRNVEHQSLPRFFDFTPMVLRQSPCPRLPPRATAHARKGIAVGTAR